MIIKIDTANSTKTGRMRLKQWKKRLIVQHEVCYLDKDGDEYYTWENTSLEDGIMILFDDKDLHND